MIGLRLYKYNNKHTVTKLKTRVHMACGVHESFKGGCDILSQCSDHKTWTSEQFLTGERRMIRFLGCFSGFLRLIAQTATDTATTTRNTPQNIPTNIVIVFWSLFLKLTHVIPSVSENISEDMISRNDKTIFCLYKSREFNPTPGERVSVQGVWITLAYPALSAIYLTSFWVFDSYIEDFPVSFQLISNYADILPSIFMCHIVDCEFSFAGEHRSSVHSRKPIFCLVIAKISEPTEINNPV